MRPGHRAATISVPLSTCFKKTHQSGLTIHDLVHQKEAWDFMVDQYEKRQDNISFIDYFWTYRFTHLPLFNLLSAPIPRASVYHTISTGYAGMIAAVARHVHRRPMLLTEHGIYTKERKLEIAQAEWIFVAKEDRCPGGAGMSARSRSYGSSCLKSSATSPTRRLTGYLPCTRGNRKLAISEGADHKKIEIIPNGIEIERFETLKPETFSSAEKNKTAFTIAFVGRVVPNQGCKNLCPGLQNCLPADARTHLLHTGGQPMKTATISRSANTWRRFWALKKCLTFTGPPSMSWSTINRLIFWY